MSRSLEEIIKEQAKDLVAAKDKIFELNNEIRNLKRAVNEMSNRGDKFLAKYQEIKKKAESYLPMGAINE